MLLSSFKALKVSVFLLGGLHLPRCVRIKIIYREHISVFRTEKIGGEQETQSRSNSPLLFELETLKIGLLQKCR